MTFDLPVAKSSKHSRAMTASEGKKGGRNLSHLILSCDVDRIAESFFDFGQTIVSRETGSIVAPST